LQQAACFPRVNADIFYGIFRRIDQAQEHITRSKRCDPERLFIQKPNIVSNIAHKIHRRPRADSGKLTNGIGSRLEILPCSIACRA
jgi:hypothetical protein